MQDIKPIEDVSGHAITRTVGEPLEGVILSFVRRLRRLMSLVHVRSARKGPDAVRVGSFDKSRFDGLDLPGSLQAFVHGSLVAFVSATRADEDAKSLHVLNNL